MKRSERWFWGSILTLALFFGTGWLPEVAAEIRKCCTDEDAIGAVAVPEDDSVTNDKMADDDFGNWSCVAGVCTLDDDVVAAADMANGDHGAFTYTNNVAALDTGAVAGADALAAGIVTRGKLAFGSGTWPETEVVLCPAGAEAAGLCNTWTNLPAAVTTAGQDTHVPFAVERYSEVRVVAVMSVAAVAGDLVIQCDDDVNFGSAATLAQVDNPTTGSGGAIGAWTAVTDCGTPTAAGDFFMRVIMVNGDTTEDPAARHVRAQFR